MTEGLTIGERVAFYRRRRGLSQDVVAGLIGRTEDWLSKIENNRAELDRLSVIRKFADVLDVPLGDLLGEPTLLDWSAETGTTTVPALRAVLMDYRQLNPVLRSIASNAEPAPLDDLDRDLAAVLDRWEWVNQSELRSPRRGARAARGSPTESARPSTVSPHPACTSNTVSRRCQVTPSSDLSLPAADW